MNLEAVGDFPQITAVQYGDFPVTGFEGNAAFVSGKFDFDFKPTNWHLPINQETSTGTPMANQPRRIVQVFIADTNENVPLEKSVLYSGDQKLTDLNDQELFFELPIADKLKEHNEARVKYLDKEASKRAGKDVFLDAAKIRDLKMLVVTIAQF